LLILPTLDRSGAEKQLVLLAAGLPRSEFDVHVCALQHSGPLAAELREAGIDIARRTVAKYREAMRIPSSVQRRREKQSAAAD